jgi:hypothetical protein
MFGPWKCCSTPKEVARSPPDDSALRMHVALSPGAAALRSARRAHRAGVAERDEEELDAGGKTIKEQREATKSGGRVQAR